MTVSSMWRLGASTPASSLMKKTIFIPEPNPRVPGNALFMDADEVVLNRLPGLKYQVRLRLVEVQDWSTPPPSEDNDGPPGRGAHEDDDSDDSNHNRRHPSLDDGGDRPRQHGARSVRFVDARDNAPHLGVRRGPTFMSRGSLLVGSIRCPLIYGGGKIHQTTCAHVRAQAVAAPTVMLPATGEASPIAVPAEAPAEQIDHIISEKEVQAAVNTSPNPTRPRFGGCGCYLFGAA